MINKMQMCRALTAAAILTSLSHGAMAEWSRIGQSEMYVDKSSIEHSAGMVTMWSLSDLETPKLTSDGAEFSSLKIMEEFDCIQKRSRVLAFTVLTGRMAEGKVLLSQNSRFAQKFRFVAPNTEDDKRLKIACETK